MEETVEDESIVNDSSLSVYYKLDPHEIPLLINSLQTREEDRKQTLQSLCIYALCKKECIQSMVNAGILTAISEVLKSQPPHEIQESCSDLMRLITNHVQMGTIGFPVSTIIVPLLSLLESSKPTISTSAKMSLLALIPTMQEPAQVHPTHILRPHIKQTSYSATVAPPPEIIVSKTGFSAFSTASPTYTIGASTDVCDCICRSGFVDRVPLILNPSIQPFVLFTTQYSSSASSSNYYNDNWPMHVQIGVVEILTAAVCCDYDTVEKRLKVNGLRDRMLNALLYAIEKTTPKRGREMSRRAAMLEEKKKKKKEKKREKKEKKKKKKKGDDDDSSSSSDLSSSSSSSDDSSLNGDASKKKLEEEEEEDDDDDEEFDPWLRSKKRADRAQLNKLAAGLLHLLRSKMVMSKGRMVAPASVTLGSLVKHGDADDERDVFKDYLKAYRAAQFKTVRAPSSSSSSSQRGSFSGLGRSSSVSGSSASQEADLEFGSTMRITALPSASSPASSTASPSPPRYEKGKRGSISHSPLTRSSTMSALGGGGGGSGSGKGTLNRSASVSSTSPAPTPPKHSSQRLIVELAPETIDLVAQQKSMKRKGSTMRSARTMPPVQHFANFDNITKEVDVKKLSFKTPSGIKCDIKQNVVTAIKTNPTTILIDKVINEGVWVCEFIFSQTQKQATFGFGDASFKPPSDYRPGRDFHSCGYYLADNSPIRQDGIWALNNGTWNDGDTVSIEVDMTVKPRVAHFFLNGLQAKGTILNIPKEIKFMALLGIPGASFEVSRLAKLELTNAMPLPQEVKMKWSINKTIAPIT
ncbi:uncharacterized protein MONOS_573 [Monocercomonoides exilis]|uniref:uncharacterized protein n=1 Tax=Monocercomonoides exilis TaxID=2049356 RepID=UPI003559B9A5|nr:hypothetical protein MONOS_573 [Monocercomonoides exilis]|eukprot:MONOS_573.1-p1 / transcript=MONOS_573.1 / gene=MONOS_573 / organism=Monocercomonoides_exilis_PA203 / gene_product=unspecified product / transcript_product=unspecified product / location=Mono_scaffold00009:96836-100335(+) / protein_length=809 / sequence_SO=supercontig / SO=protein_coding / is_pseudo=false